jgi:hypothetical protein
MQNIDMKKTLKHLYKPSAKTVSVVDVPPMPYLMIDGSGNPNTSPRYQDAVVALYSLSYAIRAIRKDAGEKYTVMPLEGLWSYEGQSGEVTPLTEADKDTFQWTLMILQPDSITADIVTTAREITREKKDPALLDNVRFETYHEGKAVQLLHIGSYDDETPAVARLHQYIADNGWSLSGTHHEIYLNDPRKVAPEKLKTVIRQPFTR